MYQNVFVHIYRGFVRQPCYMAGTIDSISMGQIFFLMQNIFIVPVMQHGCRAKLLFATQESVYVQGNISNPTGIIWYSNMAAISLPWDTNMVAVTS